MMAEHGVPEAMRRGGPTEVTEIDTSTASIARVYDHLLGGKDNFEVDREAAAVFQRSQIGDVMELSLDNRAYLIRAVRFLSEKVGISQFIDLGSGLPTQNNVHHVAQEVDPDARVIYVDNDPVVLAHGRALLAENSATQVIQADMSVPERILSDPMVTDLIDFERPVAFLCISVLHCVPDSGDPAAVVSTLMDAAPSGSYLALSHPVCGEASSAARTTEIITGEFGEFGRIRTPDEVRRFFGDLRVLDPGLLDVRGWANPESPAPDALAPCDKLFEFGGVAMKE